MVPQYFGYIMASYRKTLYVGVTNDLEGRVAEHKSGSLPRFARRYNIRKLVYFEDTTDVRAAIEREKEIKGWVRAKKIVLVDSANPEWLGLSEAWLEH